MKQDFTTAAPTVMYIDINSCFATIEQQAHPKFQGKPLAVAAFNSPNGVILAASQEAKKCGVQTGMRIADGKKLCPALLVTTPDPEKYRFVNKKLTDIALSYSPHVQVQSIDEMIVRMDGAPYLAEYMETDERSIERMMTLGKEIKQRIRNEIGEYITVSIGIAPNAFLAKTASNLKKPDGLQVITKENIQTVLASLSLTDLCGIKQGNATRLRMSGITTPSAMYGATMKELERAFHSVTGHYWWMWLHGWEIGSLYAEHEDAAQKSYGQSSSLKIQTTPLAPQTIQVTNQLVAKMAARLREDHCSARGIMAGCHFADGSYWQKHIKIDSSVYATEDIFAYVMKLLHQAPQKIIHTVFVGVYDVTVNLYTQLTLDDKETQKQARTAAVDAIYHRFGQQAIMSGIALQAQQKIVDRIAFGKSSL